ncbi:MAG TPA: SOS response-associated peptidase [Chthoniobacteraceae bacterium]|jgi:putative SOS response-associated peptidase YedK|nr:SOS response-associated peptidase [Chthoniobacteraceae bacterium]
MCGRYRLKNPKAAFDWLEVAPSFDFAPRFNIAPTQRVPAMPCLGRIEEMSWGIVPAWAKKPSEILINARRETIRGKRSFSDAFTRRRCLVPADGFYEWSKSGKRPYFFAMKGEAPFVFGGIWEESGETHRCCLITTIANALLEPIHTRMPVIVRREDWPVWLDAEALSDADFDRITAPFAREMSAVEVPALVNSAAVDDPRCCEPAAPGAPPPKLKIARKPPLPPDPQQSFGF